MDQAAHLLTLLAQLKTAMEQADLWQAQAPSAQALQSQMPFCIDTLTFAQWLQFVFHPKLQHLAIHGLPLPSNIEVLPMAQEALPGLTHQGEEVAEIIGQIDQLLRGDQ
ncbi:YqcC family protein [Motilimonas eburnea]|uniref:YqcC family protein n=1 Tax=Motilimonas eburnea TaxID=1737488 RepID=UPI001E488943|nr:YqcC family protein [Motilimonas eburnea]MCE2569999.1 YqcC family protein [Motilimonas eburnea]